MKRVLATIFALCVAAAALAADTKISAYPSMSALGGTEIFLGNQSGTTKTAAASQILTYVNGALASVALSQLATQATNTITGNATAGSAAPTALAIGSCSTAGSALKWTTNTGFGCNTSIDAATLGSATFAAPGAIGGGTAAAGTFTTLTANGAVNLNASNNAATNIATGTTTSTVTIGQNSATPGLLSILGPVSFNAGTAYSGASWSTVSPVFNGAAMTLNDTTASGTVATEMAYSLQAPTFTSTGGASTTITNAGSLFLTIPVCSGGVVCTNRWALYSSGPIFASGSLIQGSGGLTISGGAVNLNASANFATNVGTGSTNALVTIGGGSNGVIMNAGLATGYVKNTGFISVGTKFTLGSGTGSCTTTSTTVGGAAAGSFVCTGTAGAGTIVVTINGATGLAAPNGWSCTGSDITSGTAWTQSGTATTTCTLKGVTAANTDVIAFQAMGY